MDTLSQMLTKIRNAQMAGHKEVLINASKLKFSVAKVLEKEGFIELASREKNNQHENIKISLKYYRVSNTEKIPAIRGIKKISKPGQRIYIKNKDIRSVKNSFGLAIISTSRGIMTEKEAKEAGLGGEYICQVF